jgi:hypothetical protein
VPGGGIGAPSCSETASNTTPSHGVQLPRAPDGDRNPAAGPKDAPDLAGAALRVRDEHEPLPAQHDVERGAGLVDLLEVDHLAGHVGEAGRVGPVRGDGDHLGREVRDDHLPARLDERGGVEARAAGAAGELEHPLAGPGAGQLEHAVAHVPAAGVDISQVCGPRRGNPVPHLVQLGTERVAGGDDGGTHVELLLD